MEKKHFIDEWEDESIEILDGMEEKGNSKNEKIISDAKEKISTLFANAKQWVETNANEEKVKENLTKTKEEAGKIIDVTREKVIEISENDNFKSTVSSGKAFLHSAGSLLNDGLKASRKQLEKNDSIKAVFDKADEKIDELKKSEDLKRAVDKAEETAKKVGDSVFTGVKKFFEEDNEEE